MIQAPQTVPSWTPLDMRFAARTHTTGALQVDYG